MLKNTANIHYQGVKAEEHFWQGVVDGTPFYLAGRLLGSDIIRVRCVRGKPIESEKRYAVVDGGEGTLPYHSWSVAKGDQHWPNFAFEKDMQSLLETHVQGFTLFPTAITFTRMLETGERIYGCGERTGNMNKRGQVFPIWNVDPPIHHNDTTETMYTSIPFYMGFNIADGEAYGVLVDHAGLVEMDMGSTVENEARITVQGDQLIVYLFTGPTPAKVMQQYTELTGHMPLPARWTLGHHQSRWGYLTEQQVDEVALRFRERDLPCDAIWLDIDYMRGFRNFTWNPETFPTPQQMTHYLHAQGFHLVTIIDPGTKIDEQYSVYHDGVQKDMFCHYPNGAYFRGSVWPGPCLFPDFSQTKVRTWWGDQYQIMLAQGVDGIWNDMNEPSLTNILTQEVGETSLHGKTIDDEVVHRAGGEDVTGQDGPPVKHAQFHNAYGMEMARATYEGLLRLRPNSRPFVLTRSGTAGMQRYAALWTGDNSSRWEHVSLAMRMCLNLGMSGIPFVGADIGGFWEASNGELLVRFAQLGALMPFCRNHNALGNPDQEPWAFGEVYENAYREAIETRYRLLPYLYTLFHDASVSGAPIMRPLYYHYGNDQQACDDETEFLLGETLLSAPILAQGATSRSVYLPEGQWFDFWNGNEYAGRDSHDIAAPLDRWPLFVRGNSILPLAPVMQYVDQKATDSLTFACYMATDGQTSYTLYEDDGSTQAYRAGAFATTTVSCRVDETGVVVRIDEQHHGYQPQREAYEVVVYVGNRVLRERVQAGQGSMLVRW